MSEVTQLLLPEVGLTKPYIQQTSQGIVDLVEAGELNPLETKLKLKAVESIVKITIDAIDEMATREAAKHGSKSFELHGVKVECAEVGTKYDYARCGHPRWNELQAKKAEIEEELKNLEAKLKLEKSEFIYVNIETGESTKCLPPLKTSKTSTKITFK